MASWKFTIPAVTGSDSESTLSIASSNAEDERERERALEWPIFKFDLSVQPAAMKKNSSKFQWCHHHRESGDGSPASMNWGPTNKQKGQGHAYIWAAKILKRVSFSIPFLTRLLVVSAGGGSAGSSKCQHFKATLDSPFITLTDKANDHYPHHHQPHHQEVCEKGTTFPGFFLAPIPYADFVRKTEVDVAKLDLNFYNSRHHICTAGTAEQMNEINQRQIFSLLPCLCCSIVPSFIGDIVVIWSNWCVLWFKISNKCVFKLRENLKSRIYHLKIL